MDLPMCPGCRERDARSAALERRLADLEAQVRDRARLILDLGRKLQGADLPQAAAAPESKPARPPAKKPTGRKPGGQPGHQAQLKALLPPDRVTHTVAL